MLCQSDANTHSHHIFHSFSPSLSHFNYASPIYHFVCMSLSLILVEMPLFLLIVLFSLCSVKALCWKVLEDLSMSYPQVHQAITKQISVSLGPYHQLLFLFIMILDVSLLLLCA